MRDEPPDIAHLRMLVDQAHADVRRAESVGPAMTVGTVMACLPLLLLLVALATHAPA